MSFKDCQSGGVIQSLDIALACTPPSPYSLQRVAKDPFNHLVCGFSYLFTCLLFHVFLSFLVFARWCRQQSELHSRLAIRSSKLHRWHRQHSKLHSRLCSRAHRNSKLHRWRRRHSKLHSRLCIRAHRSSKLHRRHSRRPR